MNQTTNNYIPRLVEEKLETLLEAPTIIMITGARQVGKSTLMGKIEEKVREKYSVKETMGGVEIVKNVFNYTLDDIQLRSALRKDIRFIEKDINLALGENIYTTKKKIFIFIDEVQKHPQLFDWIKQVFDKNGKHIKFVITGSSALGLNKSVGETLAGRVEYIHVYPLVYPELVGSRLSLQKLWIKQFFNPAGSTSTNTLQTGETLTEAILSQVANSENAQTIEQVKEELDKVLSELYAVARTMERDLTAIVLESMFYGGLPRLYTVSLEERIRLLRNYISVYLEKEIGFIARNIDLELFGLSLQSFAAQNGLPLNINQVSKEVGVARASLYKYLDLLENTFLIKRIYPYGGKNTASGTIKSLSLYYVDTGILNSLLFVNSVGDMLRSTNFTKVLGSFMLSNILAILALGDNPQPVSYWQDYEGHRIDFIVEGNTTVWAIIVNPHKDRRKFRATMQKFREVIPESKNIVFVYPYLDAVKFDVQYKLEKADVIANSLILHLPVQLML